MGCNTAWLPVGHEADCCLLGRILPGGNKTRTFFGYKDRCSVKNRPLGTAELTGVSHTSVLPRSPDTWTFSIAGHWLKPFQLLEFCRTSVAAVTLFS